jgi:23S rRNA-/tRNA-specific pseudouridylate synthase
VLRCFVAPALHTVKDVWCTLAPPCRARASRASPPATALRCIRGDECVGEAGTRPGYAIVKQLLLPSQLPQSERDAERLARRARLQADRPADCKGGCEGLSAAAALSLCFPEEFPSLSSARKRIRRGEVLWEDNREEITMACSLSGSDAILLQTRTAPGLYPHTKSRLASEIDVLYEDDHLAAVVKPPGVLVHRGSQKGSTHGNTLVSALAHVLTPTRQGDALDRPVALHRLDQGTGGVLLAAKTRSAAQALTRQFEEREVGKEYEALVCGLLEGKDRIDSPLSGKRALTIFSAVSFARSLKYGYVTRVHVVPETGRTHQIRRHLLSIAHPIGKGCELLQYFTKRTVREK